MYSEITKEAFNALIPTDNVNGFPSFNHEEGEHYDKFYWKTHGVTVMTITNFIEQTTQYYIQDINA